MSRPSVALAPPAKRSSKSLVHRGQGRMVTELHLVRHANARRQRRGSPQPRTRRTHRIGVRVPGPPLLTSRVKDSANGLLTDLLARRRTGQDGAQPKHSERPGQRRFRCTGRYPAVRAVRCSSLTGPTGRAAHATAAGLHRGCPGTRKAGTLTGCQVRSAAASAGRIARSARPRWLMASLASAVSSPLLALWPSATNSGS